MTSNNIENRGRNFLNLPYAEYVKCKEEDKCFQYGRPFGPGHQCSEKSLRMLILVEDEEENEVVVESEVTQLQMELSACFGEGLTYVKTNKMQGEIEGRRVIVLIDSCASHNFINKELVEELGLATTDTKPYMVSLGDGWKKETRWVLRRGANPHRRRGDFNSITFVRVRRGECDYGGGMVGYPGEGDSRLKQSDNDLHPRGKGGDNQGGS